MFFFPFLLRAEYFPGYFTAANQAIEARRQAKRRAGFEISPTAGRSLEEQLLAIQARIQRLTGCSAGFSVPGRRSWPPSGPAK